MIEYVKESVMMAKQNQKEFPLDDGTVAYIKDPLPDNVSLESVLEKIDKALPPWVTDEIDMIYIGHFDIFDDRSINSLYADGAIYITNNQDDELDMVDDIMHEAAHAIEAPYGSIIYESGELESEFLQKRMKLFQLLKTQDIKISNARQMFLNIEFNRDFDDFLYKKVGYDLLDSLLIGVFIRPYAATSINEYFATGFTEYYLGDRLYLRDTCPKLYKILDELENLEQNELL
jgi:hypothetical protein